MKLFIFLLLLSASAHAQQRTAVQGDPSFSVYLTSDDTSKVKVYNGGSGMIDAYTVFPLLEGKAHFPLFTVFSWNTINYPVIWTDPPEPSYTLKYDTIGGWHLVAASDTVRGWFLPVGFVYLYEVRVYKPEGWTSLKTGEVITQWINPKHFRWLDYNKQPFKFLVIDEIQRH